MAMTGAASVHRRHRWTPALPSGDDSFSSSSAKPVSGLETTWIGGAPGWFAQLPDTKLIK
jgi:hypothetical protein